MITKIKLLLSGTALTVVYNMVKGIWDDFVNPTQQISAVASQKFQELQNRYPNVTGLFDLPNCPPLDFNCFSHAANQNPFVQMGTGVVNTASGLVSGVGSTVSAVGTFVQCVGNEKGLINKVTCLSGIAPETASVIGKFILLGLIYYMIPSKQEKKEEF